MRPLHDSGWPLIPALLGGVLWAALAPAQAPVVDSANLNTRLQRIERTLNSSSLLQMAQSLQELQREIREMRGDLEVQSRDISRLRTRQRDLYLDIDKRLQIMETRIAGMPPAPIPGQTPGTGAVGGAPATSTAGQTTAAPAAGPPPATPAINAGVTPTAPAAGTAPATAPTPAAPAPPAPAPTLSSVDPAAEQQAYRAAFDLLKAGQFDNAANALLGFLKNYPNGRFADNAQYWLGETYYVSHKFDMALKAFDRLLVDYPDSPKRSHAMLKIGFIHDEAGRKQQAREILTQLIQRYPQSTAAGLAKKRLSRLQ